MLTPPLRFQSQTEAGFCQNLLKFQSLETDGFIGLSDKWEVTSRVWVLFTPADQTYEAFILGMGSPPSTVVYALVFPSQIYDTYFRAPPPGHCN